jgi:flagellar hook-length control protein FliK
MNQAKEHTMAILHIQSNTTSAAQGASSAATRAGGDAKAATGFEALFALELEALDSTAIGEIPQDGEQPAADPAPATPPETAETLLASGLVLPERGAPAPKTVTRGETPAGEIAAGRGPSRATRPGTENHIAASAIAKDPVLDPAAAPRSEPADAVLPALQPAARKDGDAALRFDPTPLTVAGDKASAQGLLHIQSTPVALRGTDVAATPPLAVPVAIDSPEWGEAFAQRVLIAAGRGEHSAEIRLNPAHLGPIEVSLTVTGDDARQATVHFSAAQAPVREAIEAALPRLREMFEGSGIQLGNATVGAETSGRDGNNDGRRASGTGSGASADAAPSASAAPRRVVEGLVDTFA